MSVSKFQKATTIFNTVVKINGEYKTASDWLRTKDCINDGRVYGQRVRHGWDPVDALLCPPRISYDEWAIIKENRKQSAKIKPKTGEVVFERANGGAGYYHTV